MFSFVDTFIVTGDLHTAETILYLLNFILVQNSPLAWKWRIKKPRLFSVRLLWREKRACSVYVSPRCRYSYLYIRIIVRSYSLHAVKMKCCLFHEYPGMLVFETVRRLTHSLAIRTKGLSRNENRTSIHARLVTQGTPRRKLFCIDFLSLSGFH